MRVLSRIGLAAWTLALGSFLQFGLASAQSVDDVEAGRGVVRLSVVNGDVNVRRGDSGDLLAASVNAPLVVSDRVVTTAGSRAELQFDYSNFLRVAGDSEVALAELDNRRFQVQLARGLITWRILRELTADVEISTPSVSVRPSRPGVYRVEVLDNGTTEITVREGAVEIFTPRGTRQLGSGVTLLARGSTSDPEFQEQRERGLDDWDRWNRERDKYLRRSESQRYVSRDIYGYEDLDGYGNWSYDATYGNVWVPRVAAGWSPYSYGRWSWIDYYGWSWVSYDPWGWAPFHYGRWFYASNRWCWYPGAIGVRHYWSPGLVAFVGFGGGIGVGFGRVGWIPLAPYDVYRPWYGRGYYGGYRDGRGFGNNVIVNNTNIYNVYGNARINGAVSVVDSNRFVRGNYGSIGRAERGELERASLVNGQVPVAPTRESLRWNDRNVTSEAGSGRFDNSRFVASRQATAVDRVPFDQQRQAIARSADQAFGSGRGAGQQAGSGNGSDQARGSGRFEAGNNNPGSANSSSGSNRGGETGSWRRFGEPVTGGQGSGRSSSGVFSPSDSGSDRGGASNSGGGWRRFGNPVGDSSRTSGGSPAPESSRGSRRGWSQSGSEAGSDGGSRRGSFGGDNAPNVDSGRGSGSNRESYGGGYSPRSRGGSPSGADSGRSSGGYNPQTYGGRGGGSVQIDPPIVRDSGGNGRGSGGSFGSGRSSGPSFGGGGGSRSDSYGGGGGRSSGGPSGGGASRGGGGDGGGSSRGGGSGRDGGGHSGGGRNK